jgi:hypothetical protein
VTAEIQSKNTWLKVAVVAGFCHLFLVALGAAEYEFSDDHWWSRALSYYGEVTGSSFGYGFFAPGVTSQIRAVFDVVESDSHQNTLQLFDESNREVAIRIGDIIEQFMADDVSGDDKMKFQRELSASLSSAVFIRHPGAKSVTIRLEKFSPISMADYRNGVRPEWQPLYSAEFVNHQKLSP